MTDLLLWRHGQTDYNAQARVQGQVDIPLNETGWEQARQAAPGLAALQPARIVSSPLERARQTASTLAELTGLSVSLDEGLMERGFGQWEGLNRAQMTEAWPEQYAAWRRGEDPQGVGVETRDHTAIRVGRALLRVVELAEEAGEDLVVAVAHGSALTLGVTYLLGLDPSAWFGLRGLDNCHYARLRRSDREPSWHMVAWNLN
ncbi:Phosphoglyceromutase [Actinomyces bovis]|uniref:Phosphoglyceromutase n=1 Tax=Actinomyces bovis TaxID=1658 RepID=A0ABY1VL59_9ACTO|nr:histidine phosphatase family protein [Actinomyces bovis]SPT52553.1 Phosphoglyceromutase [Actinomyces bovis]VEG54320.1 Phosphoglyceromutase [Actinomyces israelii]